MRHAKSDWSGGGDDFDRPLNPRGQRNAVALGDWMRRAQLAPDEVLCSAAARTRQTCALLALNQPCESERGLYLASENTLFDHLQTATGTTVLMIAHNPGIAAFAACLVATRPDHPRFRDYPTGATLVADFDIVSWADLQAHSGRVQAFVIPRDLPE